MARRTTRSPAEPEPYDPADLERLKISPEVGWYMASRGIPLPTCVPKFKTPEPRDVGMFDEDAVDRVIAAYSSLQHTQGEWAGRPLKPDPWQVAYYIAPVFGWKRRNSRGRWVRVIRTAYVDVSRKNGKTTIAGGTAIYLTCADGEPGAQVYAAAAGKDQARYCFDPVKALAEKSKKLAPFVKPMRDRIVHPASGSYFAVVSSLADLLHGANIHGSVIDELHVHKTRDLVDAIETGTGARSQPLVLIITTPDDGKVDTAYAEKREYCEQLARGALQDVTFYGVIFGAEEDDDPFSEETWAKANPGYGISPTKEFLEAEANKARQSPANLARFLRLHLGLRTKQTTKYITLAEWDANAGLVDPHALEGRECFAGLDLAAVSDFTSYCLLFPDDDGTFDALWRVFAPEDNLTELNRRTAGNAEVWVRQKWLTLTPGNVTDYDWIEDALKRDAEVYQIKDVAYDRWNSSQMVNSLVAAGMPMSPIGQGFASLSAPTKEVKRLLLAGTPERPVLRHGGNPVLRWMVDNLAVAMDPAGNVKPDKAKAHEKIDGVSALVNAVERTLRTEQPGPSVYEERGLLIL
jgi:phage terminase large subunit-like protein